MRVKATSPYFPGGGGVPCPSYQVASAAATLYIYGMANSWQQLLDQLCDQAEAAEILGVSPERAAQFCREGRLAARKIGRDWVIVRAAAEELARIPRPSGQRLGASDDSATTSGKSKNQRKKSR
jgi:hypothetical protein